MLAAGVDVPTDDEDKEEKRAREEGRSAAGGVWNE
jgi:hypothetical protein